MLLASWEYTNGAITSNSTILLKLKELSFAAMLTTNSPNTDPDAPTIAARGDAVARKAMAEPATHTSSQNDDKERTSAIPTRTVSDWHCRCCKMSQHKAPFCEHQFMKFKQLLPISLQSLLAHALGAPSGQGVALHFTFSKEMTTHLALTIDTGA
jgi:hypothetical protein